MFSKLKEEDFAALRGPLESGRQSPEALASILILSIFLQTLMFGLTYLVAFNVSNFPHKEYVFIIHLIITGLLIVLSIICAIPGVYKKYQKMQYLISILISQNLFGVFFYLIAIFFISEQIKTESSLMSFTFITLIIGLLIFIVTCIRFYILLRKGEYKKGSTRDQLRSNLESKIKSFLPMIIIGSIGVVYIIQLLVRTYGLADIESALMLTLCIALFYAMLIILPEQLVILYCKYRFDSFNYNKKGNLNPMGRKGA